MRRKSAARPAPDAHVVAGQPFDELVLRALARARLRGVAELA